MRGETQRRKECTSEIDLARSEIVHEHKRCGGTGFIDISSGVKDTGVPILSVKECKCMKNFKLASRYILSNIPWETLVNQQIYTRKVTDEVSEEEIELRKNILYPMIRHMDKVVRSSFGLLFLGKHGTGKTFVGLKLLYYAIQKGHTAHYIEFPLLLQLLRRNMSGEINSFVTEILNVDILMIDEVGNESKKSDFALSEFKSLYKRRASKKRPTILVTNYVYKEFKKIYGKSIRSVVEANSQILNFRKAVDVRKLRGRVEMKDFFRRISK